MMNVHELGIRTTLAERTAEVIRQRILTLAPGFQPGERLYPGKLAQDLDVSVTPIREALKLLAAEGLVEISPRRGASVSRYSAAELRDIIAVQAGLETLAVRFNDGKYTRAEIAELRKRLDVCERAIKRNDVALYRANDDEFHRLLVTGSRSPRLIGLYETLQTHARIIEVQNPHYPDAMRESLAEHRDLVVLLEGGDVARIERAIAEHWDKSRARLCRKYSEFARVDAERHGVNGEKPAAPVPQAVGLS
jgi:DNA-binding GntR family transcriptional regulator